MFNEQAKIGHLWYNILEMSLKHPKKNQIESKRHPVRRPHDKLNFQDRIVADSAILVGKPVVKGTRLAVEFVIDLLAKGWTQANILENYPQLTFEDIRACLAYAGKVLSVEKIYPINFKR